MTDDTTTPRHAAANVGRWITSPETRAWLYAVVLAVIPLLVAFGLITLEHGGLWAVVAAAVLGVPSAALARANVPRQ